MAKVCQITGKKPKAGNKVSYSHRKTRRKFIPNLQTKKIFDPKTGKTMKIRVSTQGLRTIAKKMRKGERIELFV